MSKLKILIPVLLCIVTGCYTGKKAVDMKTSEEYFNMGKAAEEKWDYDKAIEFYEKAIELNPNYAEAYIGIGHIYYNELHLYDKAKEYYKKAIECYKKIIEIKPNDAEAHYNIGKAYGYVDYWYVDNDKAIESFKKAIELKPDYAEAYLQLGFNHYYKNEALEYYKKAIELKPDYAEAHEAMGNYYNSYLHWNYDKAIEHYEKAIALKPDYAMAYLDMGLVYGGNDNDKASECYKKTIELEPSYLMACVYMENLYEQYNSNVFECYEKNIEFCAKLIESNPKNAYAYSCMGTVYSYTKNKDKAIEYYEKAIELKPGYVVAYSNIGDIYYGKYDYSKAIEYYKKAVELYPTTYKYNELGIAYYNNLDFDEAIECYKKVLELQPDDSDAHYNLGEVYRYGKNDYGKAIEYYQKAIKLDSSDANAHYHLGGIYCDKNDSAKAVEHYEKAMKLKPNGTSLFNKADIYTAKCIDQEAKIELPENAEWLGYPDETKQDWGELQMDKSVEGNPLIINKKYYRKGIGTHASGHLIYNLNGKYRRLTAVLGLDEEAVCGDGAQVMVFGDDKLLAITDDLDYNKEFELDISLQGVKKLDFYLNSFRNKNCDHVNIAVPILYYNELTIETSQTIPEQIYEEAPFLTTPMNFNIKLDNVKDNVPFTVFSSRPLLIFYYSHHCSHCHSVYPNIQHLAMEYEQNGLSFIAISVGNADRSTVLQFMEQHNESNTLTPFFYDTENTFSKTYGDGYVPRLYLVFPDRKVIRYTNMHNSEDLGIIRGDINKLLNIKGKQ